MMGFQGDTVVISNGEEVYIWRPENPGSGSNSRETVEFFSVERKGRNYSVKIDDYAPKHENCLWIDPRGLSSEVRRGCIAKLKSSVPAVLKSTCGELRTQLEFKYRLTRPGTVSTMICSEGFCDKRKSIVDETVKIECREELIESQVTAKKNPLKP